MRLLRTTPLVIGTHSKNKFAEIKTAIAPHFDNLISAGDLGLPEPIEDGKTFEENATIKALFVAKQSSKLALADDSGLSIPSLGGFPGVLTKDYTAEFETSKAAYTELHRRAGGDVPAEACCIFVLATPEGETHIIRSIVPGILVCPPRGDQGFGFDPFFYYPPLGKTFGEIPREEKNKVSHRGGAIQQLIALVQ